MREGSLLGDLGTLVRDMCKIIQQEIAWTLKIASNPQRRKADKFLTLIGSQMEEDRSDDDSSFNCEMVALWQRRAREKIRLFEEILAMNGGDREAAVERIRVTMQERMAHFGITDRENQLFMPIMNDELKQYAGRKTHSDDGAVL